MKQGNAYLERQMSILKRKVEALYCVDTVTFVYASADTIRHCCDMDYDRPDGKMVMVVHYTPDCHALDQYVVDWEYTRPDAVANAVEI